MPKVSPPEHTKWKKGQSGNPSGKPKEDPKIRAFRAMTYQQFIGYLQKYGALTREEMAEELRRPDATMFELMFGNIVASAAKGDKEARVILIERLWGKVAVNVNNTFDYGSLTDEQRRIIAIRINSYLQLNPSGEEVISE